MIIDAVGGWQYPALGDICDVRDGTHDSPKYVEVGFPLITSKNLTEDGLCFEKVSYITQEDHDAIEKRSAVSDGDILYGMIGTVGNPVIVKKDRDFSVKNVAIFKFLEESLIFNKYLFYVLNGDFVTRQISKESKGGTQKFVSLKVLRGLKIPLPPLETQKQIVAVLEKADQLRKDCKLLEQELNSLAQSVFIEMFGDPVTNPKCWEIKPLVELLSKPLQNGAYYPKEDYSEDGVEMVHMSDVFYDFVERGNMKRVKASKKDIEKYKLTSNDILISRRSLMLEGAAKPSLIQESGEDLIFESSIIRLTPDTKQVNIMYLFYYLSNPKAKQHYVYQYITGATIKGINQTNLEKVEILVPDIEVQNSFLERESIIRNQKNDLNKLKVEIDTNFSALMQKVFSGELKLDNVKN